ncbi:DUF2625 family protein [Dactylosporangium salmoneum]|uniref:DUF2625 domain-containing protein n=1 Tax=Dactylosporangium salmoneum TaxID=53361 RepID=A0ABN3GVX9_9ACTN
MRSLLELVDAVDPAWPEVEAAVAAAPYPVVVLAVDPRRADEELRLLQVTTRSWLGAVVHRSGGLMLEHGWLRVFGSGSDEHRLASLSQVNDNVAGGMIVAQDVLGGQFAWMSDSDGTPTIWYLAPDTLRWENCERGYGAWLAAMIGGAMTGFYESLRWPGWVEEVGACRLDQAINVFPPLWTKEGKDPAAVSRRTVPMSEAMSLIGLTQDSQSTP